MYRLESFRMRFFFKKKKKRESQLFTTLQSIITKNLLILFLFFSNDGRHEGKISLTKKKNCAFQGWLL